MNFTRYLSNRSQELIVSRQRSGPSTLKEGEIGALDWVFTAYIAVFKVFFLPIVFLKYFMVCLRLLPVPSPDLEIAQAQLAQAQAEQAQHKSKKAKKLGFQPPTLGGTNALN